MNPPMRSGADREWQFLRVRGPRLAGPATRPRGPPAPRPLDDAARAGTPFAYLARVDVEETGSEATLLPLHPWSGGPEPSVEATLLDGPGALPPALRALIARELAAKEPALETDATAEADATPAAEDPCLATCFGELVVPKAPLERARPTIASWGASLVEGDGPAATALLPVAFGLEDLVDEGVREDAARRARPAEPRRAEPPLAGPVLTVEDLVELAPIWALPASAPLPPGLAAILGDAPPARAAAPLVDGGSVTRTFLRPGHYAMPERTCLEPLLDPASSDARARALAAEASAELPGFVGAAGTPEPTRDPLEVTPQRYLPTRITSVRGLVTVPVASPTLAIPALQAPPPAAVTPRALWASPVVRVTLSLCALALVLAQVL
jgi:hypothetical protein